MRVRYGGRTDIGTHREHNEDAFVLDADLGLVAVVDGVGGVSAGEVAAQIACNVVLRLVRRHAEDAVPCWPFPPDPLRSEAENLLIVAMRTSSNRILARATEPAMRGMGATAAFALFDAAAERVSIAHVGDVEVLRWRDGELARLIRIHNLAQEAEALERFSHEELDQLPQNVVTRALGVASDVQVDCDTWRLRPGDAYVLCSDGLTDIVARGDIATIVAAERDARRTAEALVNATLTAGAHDNVTVVVARCEDL